MSPCGLRMSIIQPGGMRTPFLDGQETFFRNIWIALLSDIPQRWGEEFSDKLIKQLIDNAFVNKAEDPLKAVRAIQHAVMNTNPQIRYRPGWQAKLMLTIDTLFPDWLVDRLLSASSSHLISDKVHNQKKNMQ